MTQLLGEGKRGTGIKVKSLACWRATTLVKPLCQEAFFAFSPGIPLPPIL